MEQAGISAQQFDASQSGASNPFTTNPQSGRQIRQDKDGRWWEYDPNKPEGQRVTPLLGPDGQQIVADGPDRQTVRWENRPDGLYMITVGPDGRAVAQRVEGVPPSEATSVQPRPTVTGFGQGGVGVLQQTPDGGYQWSVVQAPQGLSRQYTYFQNPSTGAVVAFDTQTGQVYRTGIGPDPTTVETNQLRNAATAFGMELQANQFNAGREDAAFNRMLGLLGIESAETREMNRDLTSLRGQDQQYDLSVYGNQVSQRGQDLSALGNLQSTAASQRNQDIGAATNLAGIVERANANAYNNSVPVEFLAAYNQALRNLPGARSGRVDVPQLPERPDVYVPRYPGGAVLQTAQQVLAPGFLPAPVGPYQIPSQIAAPAPRPAPALQPGPLTASVAQPNGPYQLPTLPETASVVMEEEPAAETPMEAVMESPAPGRSGWAPGRYLPPPVFEEGDTVADVLRAKARWDANRFGIELTPGMEQAYVVHALSGALG